MSIRKSLIVAGTSLLLAGTALAQSAIEISDPYARTSRPGAPTGAAFMVLKNTGSEDDRLISASSDIAARVELHTHINQDGVMKMRQVQQIELAAGGTTELKPGGLHIMLIDVPKRLHVDDEVGIKLVFDDGSSQAISAPVKSVTGGMMKHGAMKDTMHGGHGKQSGPAVPMQGHQMKGAN